MDADGGVAVSEARSTAGDSRRGGRLALDRTDIAILRLLVADARMSQRRIAREVGMSPPAVADRIQRLENAGLIRGYRAEIDRALLGYPLVVYVGAVAVQGEDQFQVVERLRAVPEVEDVHVVTGPKDVLMKLHVRDTSHLRGVLFEKIWNVPGIERTETFVVLGGMNAKVFDDGLLDLIIADIEGPGDEVR